MFFCSQHRRVRLIYCVSLTGRSLVCYRFAFAKPFLLTGLSIIFKPFLLSRFLSDQFRNSFFAISFCQTTLLFFTPFFGARANYMHSLSFVKGFFETRLFLFSRIRFSFWLFLTARRDYMHLRERVKRNLCDSELFKVKDCDSLRKNGLLWLRRGESPH